jgi:hypothetical protein
MREGNYKFVFLAYGVIIILIAILAFFVGMNITGYAVVDPEDCDFNISCGYTNWTSGMIYCLNESQVATDVCFDIKNDSIILDLQGFDINGSGAPAAADGIIVDGYDDAYIANGNIYNFDVGVFLNGSFSSEIGKLVIHDTNAGILLQGSDSNEVFDVTLYDNVDGISVASSNAVSLRTIVSYENSNSGVVLIGSNDSVLSDLNLSKNSDSLLILNSVGGDYSVIEAYNNSNDGIVVNWVSDSNFDDLTLYNNSNNGIVILNSHDNSFSQSGSGYNGMNGVSLRYSDGNRFWATFDSAYNGLNGYYLEEADGNSFLDILSSFNSQGIYLNSSNSNSFIDFDLSDNSLNSSVVISSSSNIYGKQEFNNNSVKWSVGVGFSGDLDLSSNIEFGSNYVYVNSGGLPQEFNSSADITLNLSGANITAPMPFVDGVFCDTDVCDINDFENDLILFDVTHFSNYSFRQSSCGDSYCSIGENCTCASDCGNCSEPYIVVVDPDPINESNDTTVGGQNQSSSGATDTEPEEEEDEEEDDSEFPWIWVYVGLGVVVFMAVFFIIGLFVLRHKGGNVIVSVKKPRPLSERMMQTSEKEVSSLNLGKKPVVARVGSIPANVSPVAYVNTKVKEPVDFVNDISSIRDYVQTISRNPKVRIRYLIDSGKKFVERRDYGSAKKIYGFIFEEYKGLKNHDEKLYLEIVRLRMIIR